MSTDLKKESLRVFWDYLKFSERYRSICKHAKTFKQPDKYWIPYSEGNLNLSFVYEDFGDIFSVDFEEWWGKNGNSANSKKKNKIEPVVTEYGNVVGEQISRILCHLKKRYDREPTLDEFLPEFIREIRNDPFSIFLKIEHKNCSPSQIQKSINKIMTKDFEKKIWPLGRAANDGRYANSRIKLPKTLYKINMLKKYLMVFTLRNDDVPYAEIIVRVSEKYPKINKAGRVIKDFLEDRNTYKEYHRYKIIAEQIIENINNDRFPGKYDGIKGE